MSACFLHNICIMEKDNVAYFLRKARRVSKSVNVKMKNLQTAHVSFKLNYLFFNIVNVLNIVQLQLTKT